MDGNDIICLGIIKEGSIYEELEFLNVGCKLAEKHMVGQNDSFSSYTGINIYRFTNIDE